MDVTCGQIATGKAGFAADLCDVDAGMCAAGLRVPAEGANKYTRGRLVCVGGSAEFPGAICMAARAGFLAGAGYVEVFGSASAAGICHVRYPSIVARDWGVSAACAGGRAGESFCVAAGLDVYDSDHPRAVLLGSGCRGLDIVEQRLFLDVIQNAACPIILDGGALSFAAGKQGRQALLDRAVAGRDAILTPHAGEAARLARGAGIDVAPADAAEPELSRYALEIARAYGATVCLKGPTTYICKGEGEGEDLCACAMREGTAALAKAGTGDVLAGVVAGCAAQGVATLQSACTGTYLHALAGRFAADRLGNISVCAEDVLEALPEAILQVVGAGV